MKINVKSFEEKVEAKLNELGWKLVELQKFQAGESPTLRITIHDPKSHIGHEHCKTVNKIVKDLEPELIENYNLEIWSPGIEREIVSEKEFEAFANEIIEITFKEEYINENKLDKECLEGLIKPLNKKANKKQKTAFKEQYLPCKLVSKDAGHIKVIIKQSSKLIDLSTVKKIILSASHSDKEKGETVEISLEEI
ncbi:MAG TPA: hypothetical protein V6C96_03425 [Vampirovibrionales bacterium]